MGWYVIPDDITIAHGSQFADVVKVTGPLSLYDDTWCWYWDWHSWWEALLVCVHSFPQWPAVATGRSEGTVNILFLKVTPAVQRAKYPAGSCFIATPPLPWPPDSALPSLMIGAGAIAAEKIRLLSVTVAGDPKEEELLKYDPEVWFMCNDQCSRPRNGQTT